ncbi:MAG: PAS domain S-box protein [Desulfurivibrio sp.]|jgi:PAS domain S-box-containing protein|nr:MAG: PAS domain S-box protein [Desulfurivibrio sp.]
MAEEKDGSGTIIALLRQAELLLEDGGAGSRPQEFAGMVQELARHRLELQLQDEELARMKKDLRAAHEELEKRIAARTAELQATNVSLQQEIELRKAVEEELRCSERRFRQLVSMSPAGIYLTDRKGRCTYANERWCAMAGLSPDEAAGLGWLKSLHPEDRAYVKSAWGKMVASAGHWGMEYRFRNKSGATVWVYGLANPLLDDKGKVTGYIGINTDITPLKQVQRQLQEKEEKYRTVADFTCDWEYWLSPKGEYLYISPACQEVSGYSPEEFITDPALFFSIIHPDDRRRVTGHFAEEYFDRHLERFDFRIVSKSGEVRWVSHACRPVYNYQGEFVGRRGAILDISYRKKIEERLISSEERLLLALDASSDGVWDRNLLTGEVCHGENWHRVLGYSDEEAKQLSLTWEELMHPDDRQQTLARVEEHLKGNTCRYEAEFRMRNKAGSWQWILSRGRVVDWDERGRPARFVGTHTDITYGKNIETELRKAHDELEQRVADRTRELEEINIALAVLLKKKREDTRELEQQIDANVRNLVEPYLAKLGKGPLTGEQKALVNILKTNLDEIITPFTSSLSSKFVQLTPTEIQVANLVKQGKRSKEIAELLNLSPGTINIHRKNIRKKLGLTNQRGNLQSVLSSFV